MFYKCCYSTITIGLLIVFIDAGYIQENGVLNLERYEKYIAALVEVLGSSLLNFYLSLLTFHTYTSSLCVLFTCFQSEEQV